MKNKTFKIDLAEIKIIHIEQGSYLKISSPKYFIRKLPIDCKILINFLENVALVTISEDIYNKNDFKIFSNVRLLEKYKGPYFKSRDIRE